MEKKRRGEDAADDDDNDLSSLPNRIQKRIEKRKRKKSELRQRQKEMKFEKIDFAKQSDESITQKYKKAYPDKTDEQLK